MESVTCNWCLKSFIIKENLNRHVCSVHLNERWDCDMCEKSFGEKQNLLWHKKNIHQDQNFKEHKQDFVYNASKRRKIVYDGTSESSDNEEIEDTECESAYS